jgi:lipid-A-disaccharide synthase-like uncharacterized protein
MNANPQPLAWLALGFAGQLAFSSRFLVQWVESERRRRSVVPAAFWWLSLVGGALLLVYALARRDPVFVLGQTAGLVVYTRNLILVRRERRERVGQWVPDRESLGA